MKLIIATHNKHKVKEITDVINHPQIEVKSLLDYEVQLPPEAGTTFIENARVKARTVFEQATLFLTLPPRGGGKGRGGKVWIIPSHQRTNAPTNQWILADDSGLMVDALGGAPGIYSSRYSGEPVDYNRNNKKLLKELKDIPFEKRTAHFICSMVLITPEGKEIEIEGRVDGFIADKESGKEGFGYDPLFYIPQHKCTIAQLPLSEKNTISHRGLAAKKALKILLKSIS